MTNKKERFKDFDDLQNYEDLQCPVCTSHNLFIECMNSTEKYLDQEVMCNDCGLKFNIWVKIPQFWNVFAQKKDIQKAKKIKKERGISDFTLEEIKKKKK